MYYQLVEANVKKDGVPIKMVRQMLEELKATWMEAISKLKMEGAEKKVAAVTPPTGGTNFAY
jgi:flagellar protein FliS